MRPLSRRQFLLVGACAVGGGVLALPHRDRIIDRLDPPSASAPDASIGPLVHGSFDSSARNRTVRWSLAYPPDSEPGDELPVALVLHGRGAGPEQAFGSHALPTFLADAVREGTPPFALAAVEGGEGTYWHRRAYGDDPQAMLLEEFLPLLAARGLRTSTFGVTGWSMGGYGALLLALRVPERVSAVAVTAAALWQRAADTAPGAFDGPADFTRHDVLARASSLRGTPLRIGCGRSDPFIATNRLLARALPHATAEFPRGGHDVACWNQLRPGDMRFLGQHLAAP